MELQAPVEAGRWKVSITGGGMVAALSNGGRISPGMKAIAIDMTLENISAESLTLYGDLIRPANVSGLSRPQFYLKRDRAILWDLQPRMPEAVTAVWEVPIATALPDVLRLQIESVRFKPRDNRYAAPGWFPAGTVAETRLPIDAATGRSAP